MAGSRHAFVPARPEHAWNLAPRLREADALEVEAAEGLTPLEALLGSLERSYEAWAWTVDDQVAAMWGVGVISFASGTVTPWLLTSDLVERYPRLFWVSCRREVDKWRKTHRLMINLIDARHQVALRWIARLGFDVGHPVPYGPQGQLFHPVVLLGGDHV